MNFISSEFLLFCLITVSIYWIATEKIKVSILLVASYVFYIFWDWRFTSLLVYLTLSNFILTNLMHKQKDDRRKKLLLFSCIFQNLIILGVFKYLNFFTEGLIKIFEFLGMAPDKPTFQILLPLGLSFFIFQATSYIIDVYRGSINPEESFINFATFVVYFPHMAAGPIMPAKDLLPQFSEKKVRPDFSSLQSSIFLIAIGLFRKIVIADTLAPMVNRVLGDPKSFGWQEIFLASIGFGLQIYGDFAGYSSIARGISRLFGIEMMVNFRQPYLATSITDFWRRWHISLSSWFRDYLYIPLGGNQVSRSRNYINLLLVMTIAGLWHGPMLGFVFWGALHGFFLVIDKFQNTFRVSKSSQNFSVVVIKWFITQSCIFFAWIFFRNPDLNDAFYVIKAIIERKSGYVELGDVLLVLTAAIVSFLVDFSERRTLRRNNQERYFFNGALLGTILIVVIVLKSSTIVPFIYFRF